MRLFSFSLLIGLGALLGHLYLYRRVVRRLAPTKRVRRGLLIGLAVITAALMLRGPIRDIGPTVERVYEVSAYSWLGFALCLVVTTAFGDLFLLGAAIVNRIKPRPAADAPRAPVPSETSSADDEPPSPLLPSSARPSLPSASRPIETVPRREVLKAVPWGVVASGTVLAAYGTYRAFAPPEITTVPVPLAKLPRTLDGLSIVQLTDVHVGSFIGEAFLQMLVDAVNAQKPDVIVITGDLVDAPVGEIGPAVATLGKLQARFGTYFVTGNHEYYSGVDAWVPLLQRIGMDVLRNRCTSVGDAGGVVDLLGVDDWTGSRRRGGQGYDLDAAMVGRDPERASVLLAHQPTNFEVVADHGIDLQISGHTHGGQVFPMSLLVALKYPYHRGLYEVGDSRLYVSRGCGFWGPPSRVTSPPEIVRYVLTAA